MDKKIKVVGLGGSTAANSSSLAALRIALAGANEAGAETELLDIRELDLPMYVPGLRDTPPAVRRMVDSISEARGLIWSSPLYQGTISGAFKNALDWLDLLSDVDPPYLTDKVVGLISTAGGVQGLQAVNTMEFSVRALRGWTVPLVLPIAQAWQVFDAQGNAEPVCDEHLRALGHEVVRVGSHFTTSPRKEAMVERAEADVHPITPKEVAEIG
jgi:FMN reductase